ncbi:MAG: hypothetical protein HOP36_16380, partial [Methyloglobulus sp.]|nr:hypothetical protein [Methyloglobulus sp.]
MKTLKIVSASALLFLSMSAFAEPHLDEAIKHATAAVEHGKAGHASVLVEHATPALEHTMAGALVAKGVAKSHTDNAVTDLEEAVKHGNMGHAEIATTYA